MQNDEVIGLWQALDEHKVRYIIVGDFAVAFHGGDLYKGILGIWIEDEPKNRQQLAIVFGKLFDEDFTSFENMDFIQDWTCFRSMSGIEINIMTDMKGLGKENFKECFDLAPLSEILGVPVRFLHYNHLIRSKEAANRPRDQWDIEELKKRNPDT
jgi:hypothetical protein